MKTDRARLAAAVLLAGATLSSLPAGASALWNITGVAYGAERLVGPMRHTGRHLSLQFYRELKTFARGRATADYDDALIFSAFGTAGAALRRGRRAPKISPSYRPYRRLARRPPAARP